jgi:type II secretory ATPase GspE/PulE/Tfp pilus assembly ATPase PilB-like protein
LVGTSGYYTSCWNCLGEFDAIPAVWCSDDPKNPTKLCPFCLRCFCEASERYKQEFWRGAPAVLHEELATLAQSKDRMGDILIRMKKLKTPELLEALVEQKASGRKLGEILVTRGLVRQTDIEAALRSQGVSPLADTHGLAYASPAWEHSDPSAIIEYVLTLAARKGASDIHLEPQATEVSVRYRIDGFSFRVDPIPGHFKQSLTDTLFNTFGLDPSLVVRPQHARVEKRIGETDYDLVVQTLPTTNGTSASIKLVNRGTFIKDFGTLGLELEDRVRLMEELRSGFGLALLSSPAFGGGNTTAYAVMHFLVGSGRDVLSLESPIHWLLDGARQVEVETGPNGPKMDETLRSVLAVRPDAVILSHVPDRTTALMATQLASSLLVVPSLTAQTAAGAVSAFVELGVPAALLGTCLSAVTCQRLVRTICRICRQPTEPPPQKTLAHHGLGADEAATLSFFKGKGCPTCNSVGYRGRRAIFEVMPGSPEVRGALHNGLLAGELQAVAVGAGMRTLRDRCLDLVREGVTTFDEFARLRLSA